MPVERLILLAHAIKRPGASDFSQRSAAGSKVVAVSELCEIRLSAAFATAWKVIANDMPLALLRTYDEDRKWGFEAIAQGDNGEPRVICSQASRWALQHGSCVGVGVAAKGADALVRETRHFVL